MKTIYKFTFILSVAVVTFSCTNDAMKQEFTEANEHSTDGNDTVWLDKAKTEVSHFQDFQDIIPMYYSWDSATATLTYKEQHVTSKLMREQLNEWFRENPNEPLQFPRNHASSYFLPYEDLKKALEGVDTTHGSKAGVRIYLAKRQDRHLGDGHKFFTHTLITPAHKIDGVYYDDTLKAQNGKAFLLDLTTPCPLACPVNPIISLKSDK